ncbi:MAG: hypothetical protein HY269_02980, partial [Deltaproteobacteria bacterium]|nr:hypothetical protein [Deltaproteobacteria bacterium]
MRIEPTSQTRPSFEQTSLRTEPPRPRPAAGGLVAALATAVCLALAPGCATHSGGSSDTVGIREQPFGHTPEGTPVSLFRLHNVNGAEARIMTYGGIVVSLKVPDRDGNFGDVVLGYDKLDDYVKNS